MPPPKHFHHTTTPNPSQHARIPRLETNHIIKPPCRGGKVRRDDGNIWNHYSPVRGGGSEQSFRTAYLWSSVLFVLLTRWVQAMDKDGRARWLLKKLRSKMISQWVREANSWWSVFVTPSALINSHHFWNSGVIIMLYPMTEKRIRTHELLHKANLCPMAGGGSDAVRLH